MHGPVEVLGYGAFPRLSRKRQSTEKQVSSSSAQTRRRFPLLRTLSRQRGWPHYEGYRQCHRDLQGSIIGPFLFSSHEAPDYKFGYLYTRTRAVETLTWTSECLARNSDLIGGCNLRHAGPSSTMRLHDRYRDYFGTEMGLSPTLAPNPHSRCCCPLCKDCTGGGCLLSVTTLHLSLLVEPPCR